VARALIAAVLLALALAPAARAELPLGSPSLPETRTTDHLARGLTYTKIARGRPSERDGWTVDVAVVADRAAAEDLAGRVRDAGLDAEVSALPRPPDDTAAGPLGFRVRSGLFAAKADADARAAALRAAGVPVRGTVFTAEDGGPTTGPWVVHVLTVDPAAYRGAIEPALSNDVVADREPLSSLAGRHGATAAVNGGYFVIGDADGTPGDLAGSSVLAGRLVSEAVDGRTDLLLRGGRPSISAVSDAQWVTSSDGARRVLDGDNRKPGLIRACGGVGGDVPTELPLHDITCTDTGELIRSAPMLGAPTESGEGVEALLDGRGVVTALREPRGGPVPPGGSVLTGTGDAADWLRAHATPSRRVAVHTRVRSEHGRLRLTPRLELGYSAGLSFTEEPAVMRSLGARNAVNLDGGGSTTMTVRGLVVTRPSDATGERPIGDAILLEP